MLCPKCGGKTEVKDGRLRNGHFIRRRKCKACGYRFLSREIQIPKGEWRDTKAGLLKEIREAERTMQKAIESLRIMTERQCDGY